MLPIINIVARYEVTTGVLEYSVPFPMYEDGDVLALWSGEDGREKTLVLGDDYRVEIFSDGSGGTVTLAADRVPVGATLALVSNIPETQELDLSHTAEVNTESLEQELDRQVQMIQQLKEAADRAVKVPSTSTETPEGLYRNLLDTREEAAASANAAQTAREGAEAAKSEAQTEADRAQEEADRAEEEADRAQAAGSGLAPRVTELETKVETLEALGPGSIYTDSSLTRNENLEYGVNVAPGGPDNYLEKTAQGLAVRGVQTAGNKVWNKAASNPSVGVIAVADGYRNLILGDLAANANMPPVDDIVSVNAADGLITILEDGVYHWRVKLYAGAASSNVLWALLFKKVGDGYAYLAEGVPFAPMPSAVTNPHLLIDFHGRYAKGDQVLIGLRIGDGWTTPTKIEMEFQLFADAALLAPALVRSKSRIYAGELQGISREAAIESDFWRPIGFDGVSFPSYQLPADDIVTPVKHAIAASKTDAFKILADGIYHLQIWTYYQSGTDADEVSVSVYIYKEGDSAPHQLNAETAKINGVGSYNHVNIDAHIRLKAGDIVVFCGGTVNNSTIISARVDIQLFPDTLSHPNHGVSQDAGNMAQVGNDLGVMVPKSIPYTLTPLPATANIDTLDAGVYLVPVSTTLQGHLPPSWAGSDDAVLIVFEDGDNPQIRRQRWLSSTNMFYREFFLSQVDDAGAAWNTIAAPSPRPPQAEVPQGSTVSVGSIVTVANAANVNAPYVVPAGGVWMVSVFFTDASGHVLDSMSYVVAGGTTVIPTATNYAAIRGFCWRII